MNLQHNNATAVKFLAILTIVLLFVIAILLGSMLIFRSADERKAAMAVVSTTPDQTLASSSNQLPPTPIVTLIMATAVSLPTPTTILTPNPTPAPTRNDTATIEAALSQMSLDQKIGQLLMIGLPGPTLDDTTRWRIEQLGIGGIIFLDQNITSAEQVAELTQALQAAAKGASGIPLFIGWNYEGGDIVRRQAGMTLFPSNMALGAATPAADLYKVGTAVGAEMRALGVNMNFAPVLDVNTNPNNPVIGLRSFGDDPIIVATLGEQYIEGLQNAGIIAIAKHFPGHGDVDVDSHMELPIITVPRTALETRELLPFRSAIAANIGGIMTGHLAVPALSENMPYLPASLSRDIVTKVLREEMHFNQVILTDDLGMKAVTDSYSPGNAAVAAILAGNDLLVSVNSDQYPELFFQAIKQAVADGQISESQIDDSVRRILQLKYAYQLDQTIVPIAPDYSGHRQMAYELGVTAVHIVSGTGETSSFADGEINRLLLISPILTHPGTAAGDNRSLLHERLTYCGLEVTELFYDPQTPSDVRQMQANALAVVGDKDAIVVLTYDAALRLHQTGDTSQIELVQALANTGTRTAVISSHNPQDADLFPNIPLRIITYGDTYGQIDGVIPYLIPQCAEGDTPAIPK